MIRIECENVEELRQLLSILGWEVAVSTEKAPTPAPDTKPLPKKKEPDPNPVPFELAQPEKAVDQAPDADNKPEPQHTLADVRAVLAEIQKSKGKDALKALLDEFGAKAVSKVPEDKLDALYERAVELNA